MLRNFTAALLATTLIAGPAIAAQSTGTAGSATATQPAPAANAKQTDAVKPATSVKPTTTVKPMVKHAAKHSRKHLARGKSGTMHQARHIKPAKTHQAKIAHQVRISHQDNAVKSAKPVDGGRPRA